MRYLVVRLVTLVCALTVALTVATPAGAHNSGLPAVPLDNTNMTFHNNVPNLVGNSMAFFERKLADGTLRRYLVAANFGDGFDIVDITDPHEPETVGRYLLGGPVSEPTDAVTKSSAGVNHHPWVDVNPTKNIVALSVEERGGATVRHAQDSGFGVQFVDISDITNPTPLGRVDDLFGPHTLRMIGDNCVYTSVPTFIIDYSDPMNPTGGAQQAPPSLQGHEFYEDPNHPGRTYMGAATVPLGRFRILDTSDCAKPTVISESPATTAISAAHEVYPAPDSSYVGVADFTQSGQTQTKCPGGGIHFYDISGRYRAGAGLLSPKLMGTWYAPFDGLGTTITATQDVNHGPCTMHSWQMQLEREIALGGLYTGGTWVLDPSVTSPIGVVVAEEERTTWGNTLGFNRDALDFVNATQWYPFDATGSPDLEREVFVNGWERGLDTYTYTGPLPKKEARLSAVQGDVGVITGKLDRHAVLTYEGWRNLPIAGATLMFSTGDYSVEAVTGADGTYSVPLALPPGRYRVDVSWAGDDQFAPNLNSLIITV